MSSATRAEKYEFLDGMRAMAMLIVLLYHALTALPEQFMKNPGSLLGALQRVILHGEIGVVIFIVLSGYCLMLPVARSGDGQLRGNITGFFRRRALRILPAYYVVLLASILLIFGLSRLGHLHGQANDFSQLLSARNIVTHGLLIHNLWFDTAFTLNGPMWSVATEWQIYFLFALILLPIWRHAGILLATLVGFVFGLLPTLLLPPAHNFYWARPWYIGLFSLGMLAATAEFCPDSRDLIFCRRFFKFLPLPAAAALASILVLAVHVTWGLSPTWAMDTLVGAATVLLIAACMQTRRAASGSLSAPIVALRDALEHPWLVALAGFSYTAYLVQHIIFKGTVTAAKILHLSGPGSALLNLLIGVPFLLIFSCWLARYTEKPFLSRPRDAIKNRMASLP